jgi:hypothetical protein
VLPTDAGRCRIDDPDGGRRISMRILDSLRAKWAREAVEHEREVGEAHDEYERELLEHDIGGVRQDVFAGGGDGEIVPGLPTATPREVYGEFEHDEEPPEDRAP